MSTVEDSLSIIAHDIKEPIVTMRQLSLSLDASPAKDQLIATSERALRQVNDLLKVARLEDGLFIMEPVSVPAVCADVERELSLLYQENHKSLRSLVRARTPLALANRELLHSIIYNFTTNALHYSAAGATATLSVRRRGDALRVAVRDYGPALPAKIWRDFRSGRLDRPAHIAMRPGSSGLGLYISAKFARYMDASVGAVRHRDGTTFYLDLPLSSQLPLF